MMKAVEEKKLSLDDDINKYLPFKVVNSYRPNGKITLRNLATHTSGLADHYPFTSITDESVSVGIYDALHKYGLKIKAAKASTR